MAGDNRVSTNINEDGTLNNNNGDDSTWISPVEAITILLGRGYFRKNWNDNREGTQKNNSGDGAQDNVDSLKTGGLEENRWDSFTTRNEGNHNITVNGGLRMWWFDCPFNWSTEHCLPLDFHYRDSGETVRPPPDVVSQTLSTLSDLADLSDLSELSNLTDTSDLSKLSSLSKLARVSRLSRLSRLSSLSTLVLSKLSTLPGLVADAGLSCLSCLSSLSSLSALSGLSGLSAIPSIGLSALSSLASLSGYRVYQAFPVLSWLTRIILIHLSTTLDPFSAMVYAPTPSLSLFRY